MNIKNTWAMPVIAIFTAWPLAAAAVDEHGHDHGAPAPATGTALPRFAAVSEAFELVGVIDARQLTVYLDRFADNAPIKDARIALELGGVKVALAPTPDGEYKATLAQELKPGVTAVTATVVVGNETDILAADLALEERVEAAHVHGRSWKTLAGWGAVIALAIALLVGVGRFVVAARRKREGGLA